jgi:Na+-transporting methylmalonyl-CoA/oxaloacetate decarboxylase gamma subunit
VAAAGFILSTAGLVLLTQLPVHGSYLTNVLPSIALSSLGMGAVFMPLTLIATTGLEDADQGLASGLFNTSQQIGGALGLAVLSTLAADKTASVLAEATTRPGPVEQANALLDGFTVAFTAAAILLLAGAVLLMLVVRKRDVENIDTSATPLPGG